MTMRLFIIAGEASGDRLGAAFLSSFKKAYPACEIKGIGGELMLTEGLSASLFPMEELSIMGIAEVLPKVPHLLNRINQTVQAIEAFRPHAVLTIDAPDFSFRVQKRVRKSHKIQTRQLHYIAPTVWAWRPGRAKKIAGFLDGIICTFPFEPPYFEKEGLKAVFTGHPVMEGGALGGNGKKFREAHNIRETSHTVGLFFGSRRGEIKRVSSSIIEAANLYKKQNKDTIFIVPTLTHLEPTIRTILTELKADFVLSTNQEEKWDAFAACDKALAVSGTVGLELAVAGVPHVIGYKVAPLTAFIAKKLVRIKYAHLGNLILDKLLVPEFIQEACTGKNLFSALQDLSGQTEGFETIREAIKAPENGKASDEAVVFMADLISS